MLTLASRSCSARFVSAASVTTDVAMLNTIHRPSESLSDEESNVAISTKAFTALKVAKNEVIGKNVHKITLDFPKSTNVLGMTTAGVLMVEGEKRDGSGIIAQPYTPVSRNDTVGRLELVVKDYPFIGNVSSHICAAKVGDALAVKGCFTKIKVKANKWKKVGMIAGGSGLTPCLQVAEELLSIPDDKTEISLIFCNQTPDDIFLQHHINDLAAKSGGRFTVHYCVDEAPDSWGGLTGYVTSDMIKAYLPDPDGGNNIIMVCGPPPMYRAICGPKKFEDGKPPAQGEVDGLLKELGYGCESVFKF